jgi:SHS2 domain-containing protein
MKKYEIIDHTADIGLKAYGRNLGELFKNSALGMFEIIADLKDVKPETPLTIELGAVTREELLVNWLRELLYQYNTQEILFKNFEIEKITDNRISAKAWGQAFNRQKHNLKMEIKAVTYYELKIEKEKEGWMSQVIFDV